MPIALEISALSRTYGTQSERPMINNSVYQGCYLEVMNIGKRLQAFFAPLTKPSCKHQKLSVSHPSDFLTAPISNRNDPNILTYGEFNMENHISSKQAQSFLARGRRNFVKQLSVIRDLRCFRR